MSARPAAARSALAVILALAALTALWAAAAAALDRPFLPGPGAAAAALARMTLKGQLLPHAAASLRRVVLAVAAAFVPAAALGLAAGRSRRLDAVVSPLLYILHPLPKVAFLPVILVALGLGEASKVFLVAIIVFSQILVAARDASARVPRELTDAVRSLGAGRLAIIRLVVVPAALPDLFTALRVSLGTAIAVLFMAETFATESGLGWLVVDSWTRVAYADMYAGIVALSLVGLGLFGMVDLAERLACPWADRRPY